MSDINIWEEFNGVPQKNEVEQFPIINELNIELEKENGLTEPKIGVEEHKTKLKLNNKKRGRKNKKSDENNILAAIHDKFSNDNLKRKVKTHFHLFIIAFLNKIIKNFFGQSLKFGKISSFITQNITVEFNRLLMDDKIKNVISRISHKFRDKDKNKIIVELIMNKADKESEIIKFLNMSYKDFFLNYYLKSTKKTFEGEQEDESYEAHIEKLEKIYGNEYIINFKRNAKTLVQFFYKCKERIRKKKVTQLINPVFINNPFPNYSINFIDLTFSKFSDVLFKIFGYLMNLEKLIYIK
jgi:hypothetical protein